MRNYALSMDGYGISREAYKELYWFCRRYPEMRMRVDQQAQPGHWLTGMPRGGQPGDPTAQAALRRDKLIHDCELIEQAAIEAGPECYQALLRNVTLGDAYEQVEPYCGRRQFYATRRKFFYLLSLKRDTAGQYK